MWEAISNVLTSTNSWITLSFILILVVIMIVLIKKGYLNIQTKNFSVTAKEKEQRVMREQITHAHMVCSGVLQQIMRDEVMRNVDADHVDRIIEKVYDEIIEWIAFNHITTEEHYVHNKVKKVQLLVDSFAPPDKKYDVFDELIESTTRDLLKDLVDIRNIYSK